MELRDKKIQISVTSEDKKIIEDLAHEARMSVSEYLYDKLIKIIYDIRRKSSQ